MERVIQIHRDCSLHQKMFSSMGLIHSQNNNKNSQFWYLEKKGKGREKENSPLKNVKKKLPKQLHFVGLLYFIIASHNKISCKLIQTTAFDV